MRWRKAKVRERELDELIDDSRKLRAEMSASMENLHRFANRLELQVTEFIAEERGTNDDNHR